MRMVSRLKLTNVRSGITDVDVYKGFAYLGTDYAECEEGGQGLGVHVVDVRDPQKPRKVAFIPAQGRVGEGIHVFHAETPRFKGDLLVYSNESCDTDFGGISVVDVTNPRKPKMLADGVGDTDANDPADPTPLEIPNDVHSVMGWSPKGHAYAVMTDNFENLDVDIMDLTNPRQPRLIAETGFEEWPTLGIQRGLGDEAFHHDMWVKKINGNWLIMASYWDAGWVKLNVNDPSNPRFIDDSDYRNPDPLTGFQIPEGNAHQGTWSSGNRFFIGTDEDFSPFRIDPFTVLDGPNAGEYAAAEFGFTVAIADEYQDDQISGPTIYAGTACPAVQDDPATVEDEGDPGTAKDIIPADRLDAEEGEEKIAVILRGGCFFSEKIEAAEQAGYDAAIIANSHFGSSAGEFPDAYICGSKGHEYDPAINAICIGHRAFHLMFNQEPAFEGEDEPRIGTEGARISAASVFDGWGYTHLLNANTLEEIDAYAIDEAIDRRYTSDFGALTVHEVETDKRRGKNLAYFSWYAGGARVAKFGRRGMREVGHYIHPKGNDFWGVATRKRGKKRPLLFFSDRDYGLFILRYTGGQ